MCVSTRSVWTEDSDANTCFICACSFGLITRKHHCRQCGQVVCDPCSQNRKLLESSRTGQLKRVCLKCWDGTQSANQRRLEAAERSGAMSAPGSGGGGGGGGGAGSSSGSPRAPVPVARLPDVPAEEAIAALSEVSFEGSWEFTFLFTQGAFPCCALSCAPTLATTPHSARAQVYKSRLPISPHLF
jgi:hypothetical protein